MSQRIEALNGTTKEVAKSIHTVEETSAKAFEKECARYHEMQFTLVMMNTFHSPLRNCTVWTAVFTNLTWS